jgi:hypothetical protein
MGDYAKKCSPPISGRLLGGLPRGHRPALRRSRPPQLFVADQHVAGIEAEHADSLDSAMRHIGAQIVEQRLLVR